MDNDNITISSRLESLWHPLCGIIYLLICLTDFVLMPVYYEWSNAQLSAEKVVTLSIEFKDSASQIAALNALHTQRAWQPITLGQNGLFHMAFGAILGVGIWSRGRVQGNQALTDISNQMQNLAAQMTDPNAGQQGQVQQPFVQQPVVQQPAPAPVANATITKVSIPVLHKKS